MEDRLIQQAFVYELDPTPEQARRFASHAGAARYAYNWGIQQIAEHLEAFKKAKDAGGELPVYPDHFALCKMWTRHKDDPANGLEWVGEHFVGTFQAALRDAHGAWKKFFDSRGGRRKGRPVGRPRFKSRHRSTASFQVHGSTLRIGEHRMALSRNPAQEGRPKKVRVQVHRSVVLPKIGPVRVKEKTTKLLALLRKAPAVCPPCGGAGKVPAKGGDAEMRRCAACKGSGQVPYARLVRGTVSRTASGRWFISLTVERVRPVRITPTRRQRAGGTVGVDWGVRHLATLSTGEVIDNPRYLEKAQAKLRRAERALARTVQGSRGREKARHRVAVLHGRVAALRLDHVEKATSRLVHDHDRIVIEGWDVAGVLAGGREGLPARTRRTRNRAVADAGIGMARRKVIHKANWYGTQVTVVGRHEPTGRTCAACGQVRAKPVPPAEERFVCPSCGHGDDRRVNSARVLVRLAGSDPAPAAGETPTRDETR
ncbi:hypothetical protein BKM31_29870 [[Actinomadura] parvosata subsp. kistnae]|uniref:Transposase n=1 Tax=[Actinomadura] parvosata subsp. kistnae TaxID=1909395 RepID=A0A1V0A4G6_9ACTN|nr:hypothetical protein BKM31_29870 [Nonomuraea sp. ATCC 55076]